MNNIDADNFFIGLLAAINLYTNNTQKAYELADYLAT